MEQLKKAFRGDDDAEQGIMGDVTSLSWSTRIIGFIICFSLGIFLSFMGTFLLFLPNGLKLFALFYSMGNIVSLSSTFFLMGPLKQAKRMCADTRAIAAIIMVVCIGLTLCAALWWKIAILAILFCAFQFAAMTWYSLSYIPFARDAIKNCFGACLSA